MSLCEEINRSKIEDEVLSKFRVTCDKFDALWSCIGFGDEIVNDRRCLFLQRFDSVLNALVQEEDNLLTEMTQSVEKYYDEVNVLTKELEASADEPDDGLTLMDFEGILMVKVEELKKEKEKRIKTFRELQEKEFSLGVSLDIPVDPVKCSSAGLPTKEQLKQLQLRVEMLDLEKERRLKIFHHLKDRILQMMQDLEHQYQTDFENIVVRSTDEDIVLTNNHILNMQSLHDQLVKKCTESQLEAESLREKLRVMWRCLKLDQEEFQLFLSKNNGFSKSAIETMRCELEGCQESKKNNTDTFVANCREYLMELWIKCYTSSDVIKKFTVYHEDNLTEDLLRLHEEEIIKWDRHWLEFIEFFLDLDKLNLVWEQVKDMLKLNDPKRFKNRGGALLQEEKDRRKIINKLNSLKEKLKELGRNWDLQDKGQHFLKVHEMTLKEFMAIWERDHTQDYENIFNIWQSPKLKRQRAKTQ